MDNDPKLAPVLNITDDQRRRILAGLHFSAERVLDVLLNDPSLEWQHVIQRSVASFRIAGEVARRMKAEGIISRIEISRDRMHDLGVARGKASQKKAERSTDPKDVYESIILDPDATHQARLAAAHRLHQLDRSEGGREIGPGPPLTEDGKVERLGLLLEACGVEISEKAWERAFPAATEVAHDGGGVGGEGLEGVDGEGGGDRYTAEELSETHLRDT